MLQPNAPDSYKTGNLDSILGFDENWVSRSCWIGVFWLFALVVAATTDGKSRRNISHMHGLYIDLGFLHIDAFDTSTRLFFTYPNA